MKNQKTRLFCLLFVFTFLMSTISGCAEATSQPSSNKPAVAATAAPVKKDSIVIAMANEPTSLSPYDHNAIYSDYMNQLTYNGLFRLDEKSTPIPDLVDSYKNISDTEWQFKIFDGVKFHDGTIMTSADVKASLDYAKTFPAIKPYTMSFTSVAVVDNLTVKVITNGPSATLLYDLANHANYIVPKALIDNKNNFNTNPIGSGPYKYKAWTLGDKLEFVKFDDYFDKKAMPSIKNITWKIIPEGSSRTIGIQNREIDLLIEVDTTAITKLKEDTKITVIQQPSFQHNWLMLNNEKAPFNNPLVRKAINAAINRDSVITVALNGLATPITSQTPFNMVGASTVNSQGYDVAAAKKYLADSKVDPASIKLELICSSDLKRRAAGVIQSNLADIGISNVTITSMDLATYLSATSKGDYTGAIGGYLASNMVAFLQGIFISSSIGGANRTRINDPKIDALINKAAATVDPVEQEKILKQASELLNEATPEVPLYQDLLIRAYNKDLDGVAVNAAGVLRINKISWK